MREEAASSLQVLRSLARHGAATLLGGGLLLASCAAFGAGKANHYAIRGEKAEPAMAGAATPGSTAHFGCELRSFVGARLFCYGPDAIRKAYGIDRLIAQGHDGTGQTIVIIDAYGSPTIQADVAAFSTLFGLPAANLTIIPMPGLAPFDYTDPNQLGWAEETSLDVQWSHAIAPGAHIILLEAASNNDPDLLAAQNYAISNHLGGVISESYGESEYGLYTDPTGVGLQILADDEASYARAVQAGIGVYVSAGDNGDTGTDAYGNPAGFAVAQYPASSPNVTSVGGTNLFFGTLDAATPNGGYLTEAVWNDGYGAGGGGISGIFAVPAYQSGHLPASTLTVLGGYRGYPDIAYNAGVVGGVLVNLGFLGPNSGFYIFGGTSAGAPQWAAIATVLGQVRGRPLGNINNRLYRTNGNGGHDVTAGDNGYAGLSGYIAAPSWDLSTGWGTPNYGLLQNILGD